MSGGLTNKAAAVLRAQDACRELTRRTARNFYYTFAVLPRDKHRDMCTLYAFMRRTDDLADSDRPADDRRGDLTAWRAALDASLTAATRSPSYRDAADADLYLPAVAEMILRRGVRTEYLHAVIDGCLQDTTAVALQTSEELREYCYRVAGAVGLCCVRVWGYDDRHEAEVHRLSIDTGYAFQMTNILRDLREDARQGRMYLPAEAVGGVTVQMLAEAAGRPSGELADLVRHFAADAAAAYERSADLLPLLSRDGRRVLTAMRLIYGGLLRKIRRREYDVFSGRVRLSRLQKLRAVWTASRVR